MRRFSWLQTHSSDPFVKLALKEGYRSRAAYKLLEMDRKFKLIMPQMKVLDLGAAPGSWSQVAVKASKSTETSPRVVAADWSDIQPIVGCRTVLVDLRHKEAVAKLKEMLQGQADVVISDMSDKHCGDTDLDSAMSIDLNLVCLTLASELLKPSGKLVMKLLMGADEHSHYVSPTQHFCRTYFHDLVRFKPKASKLQSKELYYVGLGFKPK
jgi:23S rRNA (uridine2552-2'-O)-methyltransferase